MATILDELAQDKRLLYRHTVKEYERMIANGSIAEGEPFELLDGQIVRKLRNAVGEDAMTVGVDHALVVKRLGRLSRLLEPLGCHMQTQQPVALPPYDEPEPDGAIVRGKEDDYGSHHPTAAELLCTIEVADASLKRDRGYKLAMYATAGISTYVIVNLVDRLVEVYTGPKSDGQYATVESLAPHQDLSLPTASGQPLIVPIRQLLP